MVDNYISSLQNSRVKFVVQLQQKSSERRKAGLFVVEGRRELMHCVNAGYEVDSVFYCSVMGECPALNVPCFDVSKDVYEKIAYRDSTEGVVALVKTQQTLLDELQLPENPLIVVLAPAIG